jgi:hypothetical protein
MDALVFGAIPGRGCPWSRWKRDLQVTFHLYKGLGMPNPGVTHPHDIRKGNIGVMPNRGAVYTEPHQ